MVKCYKDGDRMTVVFYDCNKETQEIITNILRAAKEKRSEEITVPGVVPAKAVFNQGMTVVDMEEVRKINYNKSLKLPGIMPFSGMTVSQALKTGGINALIQIDSCLNLLDKVKDKLLLNTIKIEFKEFAEKEFDNLKDIDSIDIDYMKNYIINIENVLQNTIDEILQKTTYESSDLFVMSASEFEIKSAFATLVKALKNKY